MPRGREEVTLLQYRLFLKALANNPASLSIKAVCAKHNLPYRKMINLRFEEKMKQNGYKRNARGWKKAEAPKHQEVHSS